LIDNGIRESLPLFFLRVRRRGRRRRRCRERWRRRCAYSVSSFAVVVCFAGGCCTRLAAMLCVCVCVCGLLVVWLLSRWCTAEAFRKLTCVYPASSIRTYAYEYVCACVCVLRTHVLRVVCVCVCTLTLLCLFSIRRRATNHRTRTATAETAAPATAAASVLRVNECRQLEGAVQVQQQQQRVTVWWRWG